MMNRNLVILAGGISSRMKHSSASKLDPKLFEDANIKSKSMIGLGNNNRPFLDYLLYNASQAGYEDVTIVIGEKDNSIKQYYGNSDKKNKFLNLNISYAIQLIPADKEKPIGTADALYQALLFRSDWSGKKFTVCNSDNLYSIKALKTLLYPEYQNAMCDYDREALEFETERIIKFAITVKDHDNFLINIIEKPGYDEVEKARDSKGTIGVSMNIFMLDYNMIFPALQTVPFNPERNEKELPDAIKLMLQKYPKSLFAYPFAEHVPDLTHKNDIIPVKEYLMKNYSI